MSREDIIRMKLKELRRLNVINQVFDGKIIQKKASEILELSDRQVRRILSRVKQEGETGVIHRSRGRVSNRKLSTRIRKRVLESYRKKYLGFGPTLANEKLKEVEGIEIGTQTLRNWLIESELWSKKRKSRSHRRWRSRKEYMGEMVQMDGSHHDWLEGRGPELVLMGYIDDAASNVFGRFYDYEGTIPAMDSFKQYIKLYGLPQSLYLDKHTTYKSPGKPTIEEELEGRRPMSQFERALDELSVKVIHANSPQAKGRIERLFGTFQDRLIKEMRLKSIKTKEEANNFLKSYLPLYNRKFSKKPTMETDLHTPLPKRFELDKVLCIKTKRGLRNDFTISHNKKLYQIIDHVTTNSVIVEERTDGSMGIKHNGVNLKFKEIALRPAKVKPVKDNLPKPRKVYIPPTDHPWKKYPATKTGHF